MYVLPALSVILVACSRVVADDGEDNHDGHDSSTITSSATLECATGEAQTRYESCSSSISSKIDQCDNSDLACACSHANTGFGYDSSSASPSPTPTPLNPRQDSNPIPSCLTSYCNTHTEAVCAASYLLNNFCAAVSAPGPTLTDYTCPGSLTSLLASVIPTDIESLISSDVDNIPSDMPIPFFNGNGDGSGPESASAASSKSEEGSKTSTGDVRAASSATMTGGDSGAECDEWWDAGQGGVGACVG
ncbi:hypothetical protein K491DRAFT_714466 [Lophiostoma macrostomum CBS 122681]|uniref:Extracellular membrane protein CFEM domain-containing protein n=1 Tax=Lophiostoma macrostomum CBS 122681 TaxID=1314788 RepID=A0A6A6TDQ2_9PLEO|nr:hypothetical protein K491DRAFT_714466 [Lophiostoma macrostomum CBS 122681]